MDLLFPDILLQCAEDDSTYIDIIHDLVLDKCDGSRPVYDPEAEDKDFAMSPEAPGALDSQITLEYKAAVVKYWRTSRKDGQPASFHNVRRRYRKLTHARYLWRYTWQTGLLYLLH